MKRINPLLVMAATLFVSASACHETIIEEEVTMSVTPNSLSLPTGGGAQSVTIALSSSDASWTAVPSESWIGLSSTSGRGSRSVSVTASPNEGAPRTGTIAFTLSAGASGGVSGATVTVSQDGLVTTTLAASPDAFDGTKRASTTYQLLVYSFCDSDGDGVGDFAGITSKMDYFDDLGVTALWLSPVHPTSSYHGYDVNDYTDVNPLFGTKEDFREMVAAAHSHGIEIYLDYVLNHSGKDHSWFREACEDADSPYRDYYFFSDNPGRDYSSFPMLAGTSYSSGEWKPVSAVTAGWNLWFWESGKDGISIPFVSDGGGAYHLVKQIDGSCGMLVRKYPNWNTGSKYGAGSGGSTLKEGSPLVLTADGADISFTGSGRYRIDLAGTDGTPQITISLTDEPETEVSSSSSSCYYMGAFSDWMPDLNYGDPAHFADSPALRELVESARGWVEMGVDGFRLDAVKHICGGLNSWNNASNKAFLSAWYDACNAAYKAAGHDGNMYMVGEVFNEYNDSKCLYSTYLEALPSVFDFSFWWRLCETLNGSRSGSSFVDEVLKQMGCYAGRADGVASLKLSNHDETRAATLLGKNSAREKQAAAILLSSQGKPFIYQGEELGYTGKCGSDGGRDELVRTPMNWDGHSWAAGGVEGEVDASLLASAYSVGTQDADANSLLNVYRSWSRVRNIYPALAGGTMSKCSFSESAIAAWYMTASSGEKMLVIHNVSSSSRTFTVADDMSHPVALLGSGSCKGSSLTLGANSSVVFKL